METQNLVRMANRIGQFFEATPQHAVAVEGVANHIRKFWEPRMRRDLLAWVDANGATDLHPLVAEVVADQRERIA
ncbi:formate dehydrogenase subunit delta [Hydrogenophaga sp. 5NK40-0174]|uniref:formate dehydrogenase subunit delta n=1 Tax=Hydrogenophaga sp. 5NK40-0174 TaxID=3127649 RepID=UPI003340C9BC